MFRWRNVLFFKKESNDKPNLVFGLGDEASSTHIYLSALKIFKPSFDEKPELVKEILCESNKFPCMDYGPSNIYFNKCLYYFKRLHG